MAGLAEGARAARLVRLPRSRLFGGEVGEIIPAAIIFGGMGLTEIPALGAVGCLGRGMRAGSVAAVAVAEAHFGCLPRAAIAPPARKSPIVRTRLLHHDPTLAAAESRGKAKMPED